MVAGKLESYLELHYFEEQEATKENWDWQGELTQ